MGSCLGRGSQFGWYKAAPAVLLSMYFIYFLFVYGLSPRRGTYARPEQRRSPRVLANTTRSSSSSVRCAQSDSPHQSVEEKERDNHSSYAATLLRLPSIRPGAPRAFLPYPLRLTPEPEKPVFPSRVCKKDPDAAWLAASSCRCEAGAVARTWDLSGHAPTRVADPALVVVLFAEEDGRPLVSCPDLSPFAPRNCTALRGSPPFSGPPPIPVLFACSDSFSSLHSRSLWRRNFSTTS
jgi:hypothetical protein